MLTLETVTMADGRALRCSLLIFIFMYLLVKSFVGQGSSKDLNYLKVGEEISIVKHQISIVKHQMPLRRTRSSIDLPQVARYVYTSRGTIKSAFGK